MPVSEAQIRAKSKYRAKAYDVMQIQVKKGQRDVYKAQAAARGLSLNAYIVGLLEADRQAAGPIEPPAPQESARD